MRRDESTCTRPCPEPEVWALLAAGLCEPARHSSLLDHAASCSFCADRLRDLIDAVAQDEPPDSPTDPIVDTLAIHSEEKRRRLAEAMAGSKGPVRGRWLIPIAAMLIAGLGAGGWVLTKRIGGPPLRQLALAYSARRTLELQVPGAAYAPITVERGPASSFGDLPPALLESQIQIKRHLDQRPDDPDWLHAQGRAALLLWDFDIALRSFQTAADLGAKSPDFLVDFGIAYFERAERNGSALDYALGLEKLGQALQQQPAHLPALFNRAIIRGKLYQYDPAIADFEEYVRREPDAGWREEARRRLEELRNHRAGLFERRRALPDHPSEDVALDAAMTSGLSGYFRNPSSKLQTEAAELVARHQDPWLLEVTRLRATPALFRIVDALSEMAKLRTVASGEYGRLAGEIRFLEDARLPPPLRIWRDYEMLYHTARTMAVANCPDTAESRRASRRYPWFEAQILLESSLCAAGRQDFSGAAASVDDATRIAEDHHLRGTLIRVPNFRGQRLVETGFCSEAIQTATEALAQLEAGGYPLRRAYDFQVIVLKAATQLSLPHTAYGAAAMMASVGRGAGVTLFEMIGECQRAQFALALGRKEEAGRAYAAAQIVFRNLGENANAGIYWRVARAGWMEMHGDRDALYRMLREARDQSSAGKDNLYFNRKLIAAMCRLESQAGHARAVEDLAEPFWVEVNAAVLSKPSAVRTYLPEIESVSRSLTYARLLAGNPEGALTSWQRFITLYQRLLGGQPGAAAHPGTDAGAAVLTVAELNGRAALWLSTHGRIRFHWAAGSHSDLLERARLLRRLASLASVPEHRIAAEARRLYSTLFPSGTGGARRVYIQAQGELNALPLSTFFYAKEGQDAVFSFLPFGGILPASQPNPQRVTIVAATVFDRKLGALADLVPSLEEEVDAVGAGFADRFTLSGVSATAKAMEGAAMRPGVLHFAGHAIPWRGGIGLVVAPDAADAAPDGRAGIWTMARPRLVNSGLIVFSACRTGEFNEPGSVRPGQLSEAALLAGAGEVVATLWDVDSMATAAWMRSFYSQLAAGRPPSLAAWMANLEMRSKPMWRHPRYWAGFAGYAQGIQAPPSGNTVSGRRTVIH